MHKPKILFVAPFPLSIRNLVYSGLAMECSRRLGAEVIFASPYNVQSFVDEFGNSYRNFTITSQIEKGGLQSPVNTSFILKLICAIRMRMFAIEMPTGSYLMRTLATAPKLGDYSKPKAAIWAVAKLITILFKKHGTVRKNFFRVLSRFRPEHAEEHAVIKSESPDLVVLTSHCTYWADIRFQIEAERANIPVVSFVFSWDNLFSRGPMMRTPARLLVWSQLMKQHAIEYHDYPESQVDVIGAVQFSHYKPDIDIQEVYSDLRRIGISPGEEYFLYVPGAMTWEYDAEDFRALFAKLSQSIYRDVRIVFRPHPQSPKNAYKALADLPIVFDVSPNITEETSNPANFNANEMRHMGCLIKGAKAVISSWGTTALLESAIYDRPTLQLRWMTAIQHNNKEQLDRVVMFQRYRHLIDFDKYTPRHFCDSPETLVDDLNYIFANDHKFAANRKKTVEFLVKLPFSSTVSNAVAAFQRAMGQLK